MATATTTQHYRAIRKTPSRRLENLIDVGRTHVAMFGYLSAARALLSRLIARDNISRNSQRVETRCGAIDVHCENAVDFTVPEGNLPVTMYNPFFGQTFQQCIEHLHDAAVAQPARKIWIAYINPWLGESTLEQSGYFQRVQQHRPIPRNWTWSLWQHV